MMDNNPIVSFIIPCFNQAGFLYETISSVILSYSGPKEILVIDDSSTNPGSAKKIQEIKEIFPIVNVITHEENRGLSATRNTGISFSTGEFIQFLDADDLLLPGKVDYQIEHFRLSNKLDISVTDYYYGDESLSEFTIPEPCIGSYKLLLDDFLYKWERGLSIPIHCALFRKEILSDDEFDVSLTAKEDWVFWSKQSLLGRKISYLNRADVIYRLHHDAMTKSKLGEMGKMWVKASLIIHDLLNVNDYSFLTSAMSWYEDHYKNLIDFSMNNTATISADVDENDPKDEMIWLHTISKEISESERVKNLTFSVVIPVYNHFKYLKKCFESVVLQSYREYEIICVDDNSTDPRVKELLKSLDLQLPNLKVYFNNENVGISSTLNQAIEKAEGKYIAFLDCDDYLAPNALEEVSNYLSKFPDGDYFFSDKIDVDENDKYIRDALYGGYPDIHPSRNIEEDLLDGMVASHLKVIRRKMIIEVGGCDTSLVGVQDYDLALRISGRGQFVYINKPLYYHRQHQFSVTNSQTTDQFRKMNIARRNFCDNNYNKKCDPTESINYFKECIRQGVDFSLDDLEKYGIALFTAENISMQELKREVKSGSICILDARTEYQQSLKYFIREYNSYLDLIFTDDAKLAISILGFLWNYEILWFPIFLS